MKILYFKQRRSFYKVAKIFLRVFKKDMKVGLNQAREICNVVRKNFPYESPWLQFNMEFQKIAKNKNIDQSAAFSDLKKRIVKNQDRLQEMRESYQIFTNTPFIFFQKLISAVHAFKIQNCGELSRITYAVLRMNGIKNKDISVANLASMKDKDYSKYLFPAVEKFMDFMREIENGGNIRSLDHVATQVKSKNKDEFVIDALFNECDTKDEMENVYKTKYGDILNVSENEMVNILACDNFPNLKDDEVKELQNLYPELVIDKKLLKTSENFFFDWLKK